LEIFFTALALDLAFLGLKIGSLKLDDLKGAAPNSSDRPSAKAFLGCGLSIGAAILLRPDGGILLAVIGVYLGWQFLQSWRTAPSAAVSGLTPRSLILAGVLLTLGAIAPLVPWTVRNLHTLHRFEPLAPRYANDADEPVLTGFNRWIKTWIADYVSVEEIYWNVPGQDIDLNRLPRRAFDSAAQRDLTRDLFAEYNDSHDMPPELDVRFAALAAERIDAAPLRYYLWLPGLRIADMWLRPRTELFNADPRWWEFNDERRWLALSLGLGIINLCYVLMAGAGLVRSRDFFGVGLFVLFLLLRSCFLGSLENPEPRYTLEMYPAVIVLASCLFHRAA